MIFTPVLKSVFSLLLFFTILTNAASSVADSVNELKCQQKYLNWIHRFGASDPFLAFQKTTPWELNKNLMNQIIKLDFKDLNQNFFSLLNPKNTQIQRLVSSDFYDYAQGFSNDKSRDNEIKKNLNSFFRQSIKSDTLLIAYVGEHHAIDFFMTYPNMPITYIHKPFNLETPFYSPDYIDFTKALGIKNTMDGDVNKWSGFHSVMPYASAYAIAKRQSLSQLPMVAFEARSSDLKRILIGEFHFVRSTILADNFPDSACLKSLGIKKIQLGLEGYSKVESLTAESAINRRNFIEGFTHYAKKNKMTLDQYMQRLKTVNNLSESIMTRFFSGKIIDNVGMFALIEKMKVLSDEGIEIKFVGIESFESIFPEKN